MNIQMIGIDHSVASVEYREKFSFTRTRSREAMEAIRQRADISGCVILSTCNRTEVYISSASCGTEELYRMLCAIKGLPAEEYRPFFVQRSGIEAVDHLFHLAAGMQSRIVGEDQILMQVKEALSEARECDCTDKVLEVLFRMAITAGKKVKSEIVFHKSNSSAIGYALAQLEKQGYSWNGMRCLVIGNGEMGKLTAMALRNRGAEVTVTVRQYRSGVVQIPPGCQRIHYGERYECIPTCSLIVSATASPNLTLRKEEIESHPLTGPKLFLDLAVPRDIEPEIATLPGCTVYDIDSFAISHQSEETKQQLRRADALLREGMEEFFSWYECRDFIPAIQRIGREAAKDINWRMGRAFDQNHVEPTLRRELGDALETSAAKVVDRLLFALRDTTDTATLRACLEAFAHAYPEEEA
ncbi:MAG: glutamyl-tRNA reductase [Eubacteriales bacterium]|nr:glutamyl-tRNA reductase [Eubacteriales bacterium]